LSDNYASGDQAEPGVVAKPGTIEARQITIDGGAAEGPVWEEALVSEPPGSETLASAAGARLRHLRPYGNERRARGRHSHSKLSHGGAAVALARRSRLRSRRL